MFHAARPRRRIPAVTLLAGALLALAASVAQAAGVPQRGIHVTGVGEVQVVPDMARLTVEVRREGEDAAALKRELDDVTAAILELTDELDIERRDVTAAAVNVYPRYRRREDEQVPAGVIARRTVEVTLRNLEDLGTLINGALTRGANGVNGVALDASNRPELERQALDLAIDDAVRTARQMAERFEVGLGPLVDASSSSHSVEPMRMMESRSDTDSFRPGEMSIRRDVQATFGIRP